LGIKLKPGRKKRPAPVLFVTNTTEVAVVQVKVASSVGLSEVDIRQVDIRQVEVQPSVVSVRRRTATLYDAVLEDKV
jgi:hypothetical protein